MARADYYVAMHGWTNELLAHLGAGREELLRVMDGIGPRHRALRPSDGRWSAANVLAHLARTEGQIAALLHRRARAAAAAGPAPAPPAPAVVVRFDSGAVLDRTARIEAPDFALPDLSKSPEQAARELARARERLEAVVIDADGQDMSPVRQSHHLFGELDFYQWVAFAGFHERRHTAQLRELAALLGDLS